MKHGILAVIILFASVSLAPAGEDTTVGDFMVALAEASGLHASSQAVAERSLRDAGWTLPRLDLNAHLTEGSVAAIAVACGIPVTTSNPQAPFGDAQVQSFISVFSQELGEAPTPEASPDGSKPDPWDHGADPRTKGKGKKKGLYKSPASPV
jgi:hypothetical protein